MSAVASPVDVLLVLLLAFTTAMWRISASAAHSANEDFWKALEGWDRAAGRKPPPAPSGVEVEEA